MRGQPLDYGPLETKNSPNSGGGFFSTESVKTQTLLHHLYSLLSLSLHRLESGVTPHKIVPKLGQVSYPTDGSAVPSPFTNNKNSTPTSREEGDERARGFLGFVVPPLPFAGESPRPRTTCHRRLCAKRAEYGAVMAAASLLQSGRRSSHYHNSKRGCGY